MSEHLTLGSLFDGSGGFPLGGLISGIEPLWASEIEPFPIRVTTKRLPFMKHYGDVSNLDGSKLPPVDIITFGSPCQEKQTELLDAGKDQNRIDEIGDAIMTLCEKRQTILTEAAMRKDVQDRIEDLASFLDEQVEAVTEYSEALVRRLIEKITVCDEKLIVEFKSGLEVEVDA